MIKQFGEEGQRRLACSTVGVFGQGGLGSPATIYLAVAGIGKLILVDYQKPDLSNLNRQILHWQRDVDEGISKVHSSMAKLREINPDIEVEAVDEKLTTDNIDRVFGEVDLIVDCLDSFEARYLMNDYCLRTAKPFVHAAVEGLNGQMTTVIPGETPCLRCLFPRPPEASGTFPILGATAGVFGALEAAEAIKVLTGIGEPLASKLLIGDLMYHHWETIEVKKIPECVGCGESLIE